MSDSNSSEVKPGFRQPWFWFVMAPLILVVFVCAGLLTAAYKGADDVVKDNYYKEGRMINQRIEEDQEAKRLQLGGELTFDMEVGEVLLKLSAEPMSALPGIVVLSLDHPVEADYDLAIEMRKVADGHYSGELEVRLDHRWYIRLAPKLVVANENPATVEQSQESNAAEPADSAASWRIVGEINLASGNSLTFGGYE